MNKTRNIQNIIVNYILIAIGAVIAAFAIEDFLAPNWIFDGGIVGVSMLTAEFSKLKLSVLTWLLNTPFLVIGWKKKGKSFIARSVFAMTVFSIAVGCLEITPAVTEDHLLAAYSRDLSSFHYGPRKASVHWTDCVVSKLPCLVCGESKTTFNICYSKHIH